MNVDVRDILAVLGEKTLQVALLEAQVRVLQEERAATVMSGKVEKSVGGTSANMAAAWEAAVTESGLKVVE